MKMQRDTAAENNDSRSGICEFVFHDMTVLETLLKASRRGLLGDKAYVFIMLGFVDAVLHGHAEEAYGPHDECMRRILELLDELVGEILSPLFLDDGLVLVVSDHGNGRTYYRV
ncbi:alkaline phosphatase family protein [Hyperthermus butylicus]|uniref:Uncharacterized protein n=1 Tax=Hyperthermus butylicus (strain DSM 5456 / JCM 9403 / PLM1-5) TaxID=415426 RepID=A2BMW8_HYPBU|nr:hypothetical protein Hbut_1507 [Hyperthermus butylicus DSM 5456]